jgi:hypothetical protein
MVGKQICLYANKQIDREGRVRWRVVPGVAGSARYMGHTYLGQRVQCHAAGRCAPRRGSVSSRRGGVPRGGAVCPRGGAVRPAAGECGGGAVVGGGEWVVGCRTGNTTTHHHPHSPVAGRCAPRRGSVGGHPLEPTTWPAWFLACGGTRVVGGFVGRGSNKQVVDPVTFERE